MYIFPPFETLFQVTYVWPMEAVKLILRHLDTEYEILDGFSSIFLFSSPSYCLPICFFIILVFLFCW